MDLNLSKLEQKEVVQQTTQTQNNNGVAETKEQSSKPIDFSNEKTNENSKKNIEILDYLNSEEFKNLSEEEQLKAFKEKYGLGLSDKELSETLKNAKKVAAEFEQRTIIASGEEVQTTNVASSNDATKAEITAKQDIIETLKQQGIEKPTQGDVYDYLVQLQASGKELTAEQNKMLKTFNALLDNGFQGLKSTKNESNINNNTENQNINNERKSLLSVEEVLSKEYLNKSLDEKLETYMDAYLSENDSEYAKLSDKEKKKYCNKKSQELLKNFTKELNLNKEWTIRYANAVLDDCHRKDEKISDFSDPSLVKKSEVAFSNELKAGINNIFNREEFKNKPPVEQLRAFGDLVFASDKKYLKLSDDKKLEYIKTNLQEKLDDFGIPIPLDAKDPQQLHTALTCFTSILKDFANTNEDTTLDKYMQKLSSPENVTAILLEQVSGTDENNQELIGELSAKMEIIAALKKEGNEEPTHLDIYRRLKVKKMNNELTGPESKILKRYECMEEMGLLNKDRKATDKSLRIINNKIQAGKTTEEIVKIGIRRFGNNKEQIINYMSSLVEVRPEDYEKIMNELKKEYSPEQMEEYFGELHAHAIVEGLVDNDAELLNQTMKAKPEDKYNDKAYRLSNKYMSKSANSKLIALSMDNEILKQKSSEALNDRQYYTKNEALEIFKTIGNEKLTSNSNLSQFTQLYMEKNAINGSEEQLFFADKLTGIGNSAITEGVAAASDSIDPSILNKYNQIVENAISSGNYSSSDTEKIRNALKTGNISQETLADTSIPESKPDKTNNNITNSETQNTNSATETKQAAQTQPTQPQSQPQPAVSVSATATAQSGQTISQIINTISTPSNTASATASATNKNTSTTKTQDTSSTKKAEALNKAAETKASIDNSIKEWEKTHNQKMNSSDIATLKSAVSSDVIDDVLKDPQATEEVKSYVRNLVENATSINDLYTKLVSIYGSKVQNKFVEVLASNGSTAAIHNFAENNGSKEIIKDLYIKCGSSTLKSELLNLLPPTTVSEMLAARQIDDLATVDYKVLKEFVLKNISSMSNSDFNYYLRYLPFDERQALVKARLSQSDFTGTEGGEIGMYAEKLGFKTNSQSQANPTQPLIQKQGGVNNDSPFSSKREDEQVLDDGIEPFFDTLENAPLDEFTNETDTNYPPGSDEWESHIRSMQTGIKVPPSSVYATYTPEDRDIDWEIGSAGATKLPFGRNYDKQKRGTVYWG